jgi:hypothetical protein
MLWNLLNHDSWIRFSYTHLDKKAMCEQGQEFLMKYMHHGQKYCSVTVKTYQINGHVCVYIYQFPYLCT